jgi:hypothetical protein
VYQVERYSSLAIKCTVVLFLYMSGTLVDSLHYANGKNYSEVEFIVVLKLLVQLLPVPMN